MQSRKRVLYCTLTLTPLYCAAPTLYNLSYTLPYPTLP